MRLHFSSDSQRSQFFRTLRLVNDDLASYASAAAPYCAINKQADNAVLRAKLNEHPSFWNCVLASLQTTAFVSLARLHDKAKNHNHLSRLIAILKKQTPECVSAAESLERAIEQQRHFIEKVLRLRNELFAHTSFEAPLVATFGFDGLGIDDFATYWSAILPALEACDLAIFGTTVHGPKVVPELFSSIECKTLSALGQGELPSEA